MVVFEFKRDAGVGTTITPSFPHWFWVFTQGNCVGQFDPNTSKFFPVHGYWGMFSESKIKEDYGHSK